MRTRLALVAALALVAGRAGAQAEVRPWGNIEGMRIEGQLIPFDLRPCTLSASGDETLHTAKEWQEPRYARSGTTATIATRLRAIAINETIDAFGDSATARVRFTADSAPSPDGAGVCLALPRARWESARVVAGEDGRIQRASLTPRPTARDTGRVVLLRTVADAVTFYGQGMQLQIGFNRRVAMELRADRRDGSDDFKLYATVLPGPVAQRGNAEIRVKLRVSATVDHSPVHIALDAAPRAERFDGMGGNFRLESPHDSVVIAYNLANLRVAWGRVELPWRAWQPDESTDPSRLAPDSLAPRVRRAMAMARTLAEQRTPFIISVWFPPRWAVIGELPDARPDGDPRGNALDPAKLEKIYASLGAYLVYLKEHYGVEPALFSFNESDLGIDVRQTPEEHRDFIKGFGAWLAAHGLATKMLLGDVSDATPTRFIGAAMADTGARRFVGAVSYHSWRGWSDSLLTFWHDAARTLGVPLLVGEGSIDAGAWRYPRAFLEPWYGLAEQKVYVRILARSRPASILQWELTADYSLLAGGGVFGDTTSALHPTQRFWGFRQLASSPPGASHVPVTCDRPETSCAAVGDGASGALAVHLVNDGASRPATITGLPPDLKELRVFVTDATRGMAELPRVPVVNGVARLTLAPLSFTTLSAVR